MLLGLNKKIDQLVMENSENWYGHALRRALELEVKGQRKGGQKDIEYAG